MGTRALILTNSLGDVAQADDAFELVDSATGRLKRSHLYDGTIDNLMDLRDFPFDLDDIELEFRTTLQRGSRRPARAARGPAPAQC
eukprot:COSAG06_NODE_16529_length_996_cov_1.136009_2_plen_86_part_00